MVCTNFLLLEKVLVLNQFGHDTLSYSTLVPKRLRSERGNRLSDKRTFYHSLRWELKPLQNSDGFYPIQLLSEYVLPYFLFRYCIP